MNTIDTIARPYLMPGTKTMLFYRYITVEQENFAVVLIWRCGGLLDDRQNKTLVHTYG